MKYDIQDTVNRINALRAGNMPWVGIVKKLNQEGYRTTTARAFNVPNAMSYLRVQGSNLKRQQPTKPQAAATPTTPVVDLRGAVMATLDFKIPADKRIELLRAILT